MIADIRTIIWKEFKELFAHRFSLRGGTMSLLLMIGLLGIFLPLQNGREWVESPRVLLYWAWVPLFLVVGVIADSFAGERERHTLETLLATRLSTNAILFGKIGAAVIYGWVITLSSLAAGLITVNLANGGTSILFYPPALAAGILGLSFLGATLAASAGVLVSLRAATVRQAQQTLSIAIMILLFVPIYGVQALPEEWKMRLAQWVAGSEIPQIIVSVCAGLAIVDLLLIVAARSRFQRSRLILD